MTQVSPTSRSTDSTSAATKRRENNFFRDIVQARIARRLLLTRGAAVVAGAAIAPTLLRPSRAQADVDPGNRLRFEPIAPSDADAILVPFNYVHEVVIRWGDPLFAATAAFAVDHQTAAAQHRQFGFNCDFVAQFPLPSWLERDLAFAGKVSPFSLFWLGISFDRLRVLEAERALLWVNHEYTSGGDMFPGYDSSNPTAEQVAIEIAAHGGSVVQIEKHRRGPWTYVQGAPLNRRITGETPIEISGPLAGHALLQTSDDPSGRLVLGMFNNCGGGITPWGTVLSAEENFDQYFGNRAGLSLSNPEKAALYARLPATSGETERKWERFDARFDVSLEPNEYARFGYIVEIDPYDPTARPRKHTALGRFKHEAAVPVISRDRRVVVYSGDDARFEYAYKFVSQGRFERHQRGANMRLLDQGVLYTAVFEADGTGRWLPLIHGEGPLTADNGFASQAEVLINTRGAADLLGATRMDRPEDIEVSPVNGRVYIALTNNSARTSVAGSAGEAAANPRLGNRWGHVVEITEDGDDNAALTFTWEIFMLCGDPVSTPNTYFAGFDPAQVSPISCPDNLDFDAAGNLWIATDGAPASPGFGDRNDGIFAVPTEGSDRGYLRQFMSGVPGCEVASLKHSGDGRTLFASIQHPGEGGGLPNADSSWPDGTNYAPRPAVIAIRHAQNKPIGA